MCERFGLTPPILNDRNKKWTDLSIIEQAHLLAYEQIRMYEDVQELAMTSLGAQI